MQASAFTVILCIVQMWPAVLGGPPQQQFVLDNDWPGMVTKVQDFTWENCGPSSEPAVIKTLTITPNPIDIPGEVQVSITVATTAALEAPLKAVTNLEKKLGDMWLKIPCVDQMGSCTYDDACAALDRVVPPGQQCPEPLQAYGIPCHCPFKAGTYNLPPSTFYIPNMDLPSFLTNGDYRLKVVLSTGEQELGCAKLSFALHASSG